MSDVMMCMLACMIVATCARHDAARSIGVVFTIVFGVVMVTIGIVNFVLLMVAG